MGGSEYSEMSSKVRQYEQNLKRMKRLEDGLEALNSGGGVWIKYPKDEVLLDYPEIAEHVKQFIDCKISELKQQNEAL